MSAEDAASTDSTKALDRYAATLPTEGHVIGKAVRCAEDPFKGVPLTGRVLALKDMWLGCDRLPVAEGLDRKQRLLDRFNNWVEFSNVLADRSD